MLPGRKPNLKEGPPIAKVVDKSRAFVPLPGYPLYEINRYGQVRRLWKTRKSLVAPRFQRRGYTVRLWQPTRERKEESVHRLVYRAFIGLIPPGKVVYHKNGDTRDNYFTNVGAITRSELGKLVGASGRRKPVAKLDAAGEVVSFHSSAREAGRANFMSYQTILDHCNGKVKRELAPDGFRYIWEKDVEYTNE